MADSDRLELRDTLMWGRRIAGLGAEVFEHRDRLDQDEKRMTRVEELRADDMVKVAELVEAIRILRADVNEMTKRLDAEVELRTREHKEHVTLHGKLNTRLKERFANGKAEPQPQGERTE
ncbi:MAG: hypothetical protein FJ276_19320 [Planctomycetes bacterium]|nr:hypothetical protein [Planctomycetota bacterium]